MHDASSAALAITALDLTPDPLDPGVLVFAVGWLLGWLLLWRLRPLPAATGDRAAVAVVVPARNEAAALPHLLPPLLAGARTGDEVIVVDDHSTDGTADVARALGARVVSPPDLPPGWLGKPHACWCGANVTSAPTLVFVDADVRPPPDLLDRVAAAVDDHPGSVVSVQPWHVVERADEQLSLLCNVAALTGAGAWTVAGRRVRPTVAFGPVLAIRRATYDAVGGHADPVVRTMHTEDIGLARAVGSAALFTGRPDVAFRMYPGGLRDLVRGWTRSIATGARYAPWWAGVGTALWVWALAGGWLATPWAYPLCAAQVWVLGRRAGRFAPWVALLFPLAVAVLLVVFVRSAVAIVLRRDVRWKDRRVAAR